MTLPLPSRRGVLLAVQRRYSTRFHMTLITLASMGSGYVSRRMAGICDCVESGITAGSIAVRTCRCRTFPFHAHPPQAAASVVAGLLVLALVALVALFGAVGLVIWEAPSILAEVVFEVLLASSLIKGVKAVGSHDWSVALLPAFKGK